MERIWEDVTHEFITKEKNKIKDLEDSLLDKIKKIRETRLLNNIGRLEEY